MRAPADRRLAPGERFEPDPHRHARYRAALERQVALDDKV
jgi:hypothetical protein